MNNYKVLTATFFNDRNPITTETHCKGMREARQLVGVPLSYSYNVKAWIGFQHTADFGLKQFWVIKED